MCYDGSTRGSNIPLFVYDLYRSVLGIFVLSTEHDRWLPVGFTLSGTGLDFF